MTAKGKITIPIIQGKKESRTPVVVITAYDYPGARLVDDAGADIILVGDSLAMTVLGHKSTVSLTMEEMLHHCKAVSRGAEKAFLVGDMPFLSYQVDHAESIRNAGRLIKEAGMDGVKLEGGSRSLKHIKAILGAGIPVMGHLGLTPQTATLLGGYKVQGKTSEAASIMLEDALALEAAGVFALVLEAVPAEIAQEITSRLKIPVIGIGAGPHCSGQVLVFHDMLGLYYGELPRFVKQYADAGSTILDALRAFADEVRTGLFPAIEHSFNMDEKELKKFRDEI